MFSEQSIGYALVGIDRKSPIGYEWLANPQTLPLGPECDLSWAGFSDEGTLARAGHDGQQRPPASATSIRHVDASAGHEAERQG